MQPGAVFGSVLSRLLWKNNKAFDAHHWQAVASFLKTYLLHIMLKMQFLVSLFPTLFWRRNFSFVYQFFGCKQQPTHTQFTSAWVLFVRNCRAQMFYHHQPLMLVDVGLVFLWDLLANVSIVELKCGQVCKSVCLCCTWQEVSHRLGLFTVQGSVGSAADLNTPKQKKSARIIREKTQKKSEYFLGNPQRPQSLAWNPTTAGFHGNNNTV